MEGKPPLCDGQKGASAAVAAAEEVSRVMNEEDGKTKH
ncbi:hypothetical protein A2U01_0065938 [Trifolium medium]|uniref:Uncharacterized protein n=1 Tax=Trifolium medium TaxID=97028 RepID=A0A392S7N3_9FABA|nr:hypothetical protein [Trifolium medium]